MTNLPNRVFVLIPSLKPDKKLIEYIRSLKDLHEDILLIDDGSGDDYQDIFFELERMNCVVIHHKINRGKGRALKTGFKYLIDNYQDLLGVVTADSDGQHSIKDTLACVKTLKDKPQAFILGTRDFNQTNVPFKSRYGNKITSFIYKLLYGQLIKDTQTGLRALSKDFMIDCLELEGERYDYEIRMLIEATIKKLEIIELPIETIYENNNEGSHFNPVKDSLKIYKIMFERFISYGLSSLVSAIIDIVLFGIITKLIFNNSGATFVLLLGTVIARIVSSLFNYFVNKKFVFKEKTRDKKSMFRYYVLCVGAMMASWLIVTTLFKITHIDSTILKIVTDSVIFILNYRIQKEWVFKG